MTKPTVYYYSLGDLAAKHPAFLQGKALISIHNPHNSNHIRLPTSLAHICEFSDIVELKWNEKFLTNEKTIFLQKMWLEKKLKENDSTQIPFSIYQAIEIIKFIEHNKDRDIVIHCEHGKSRSPAIALFLFLKYNYNLAQGKIETYNTLVLEILEKTYDKELFKRPI